VLDRCLSAVQPAAFEPAAQFPGGHPQLTSQVGQPSLVRRQR
jgi:hypothetical protein